MSRSLPGIGLALMVAAVAGAEPAPAPRAAGSEVAKLLPRGQKFAEQGRVDLFVAATAVWDLKPDDTRLWEPVTDLGRRLIVKAEMTGDRKPHGCPALLKDYATYAELRKPRFTRVDEHYTCPDPDKAAPPVLFYIEAIQATSVISPAGTVSALIVSRGNVQTHKPIQQSVIFANGDVTVRSFISSSVVVCDGDVAVAERHVAKTLIVARGDIKVKGRATGSVLIAGGKVTVGDTRQPLPADFNVIKEKESNVLGYVTFFELSTVGLEVKAADKTVTVEKVAAKSACEKAGLKAGDVIIEVSDKKPDSAESLRRLLRDALAVGPTILKLKRGEQAETAKVSLDE